MLYSFRVRYKAGAWPGEVYTGKTTIHLNAMDDDDAQAQVDSRAKREIARSMAMKPSQIEIQEVTQV